MRKTLLVLLAAAGVYVATLPPKTRTLPQVGDTAIAVRGAIHVHTRRSDGTGTVDEVAAAAERAGLNFVVVTDHGDGTRKPDPPSYQHGVLVIDAVEVSTTAGHVVAIGISQAPYPLGGAPGDAVEDIQRLGGFAIAAHPDSAKPDLRWNGWQAPFNGLELMNGDSEWRDDSRVSLIHALLAYPARPREAIAMLFGRPDDTLKRWDQLTAKRRVVGVVALDAHARIGLRSIGEPYDSTALRLPSYETMFRTMSIALPTVTLTRDAAADASAITAALAEGHVYSVIDALAGPVRFQFTARSGGASVEQGSELPVSGPVTLRVEGSLPVDAMVALFKDGVSVRTVNSASLETEMPAEAAVYRVEVGLPGAPGQPPVPWIVSNPVYVGRRPGTLQPAVRPTAAKSSVLYRDADTFEARIEKSEASGADVAVIRAVPGRQLLFRYALGGKASASPYAALAVPVQAVASYDRVSFTARADHPVRMRVQLRAPGGTGDRWSRSIYLDEADRPVTIFFDELQPVATTTGAARLTDIDSLLFVVDSVNTALGTNGQVWIDDLLLEGGK